MKIHTNYKLKANRKTTRSLKSQTNKNHSLLMVEQRSFEEQNGRPLKIRKITKKRKYETEHSNEHSNLD